ncbi:MAG TPA: regulatory iron-sulfur-containing complex subunit RicT [Propionibacteriaceae bacterium]|nr:regulatory iron-sulfur-containing complex subunit RicT [Propionibacteriaceae bacterium]
MRRVLAVTFTPHGRLYYVDAGTTEAAVGDAVLVPTEAGPEVATVAWAAEVELSAELPVCAGPAQQHDLEREARNRRLRAEATEIAKALIAEHALPMRVVGVDLDDHSSEFGRMVAIYYTAPQRVDFRLLVRDLASALGARIDLRQIGPRDAARIVGDVGPCGRELCCTTFLTTLVPVGIRVARAQDLAANQLQAQGACGRLKCCLAYEQPMYDDFAQRAPGMGCRVDTEHGPGVVVGRSVPNDTVTVRCGDGQCRVCPVSLVTTRPGADAPMDARVPRHSLPD